MGDTEEAGAGSSNADWALAVFASRESLQVLQLDLRSAVAAAGENVGIELIVHGNAALALLGTAVATSNAVRGGTGVPKVGHRWWRPTDVKAHLKRAFRQARGVRENRTISDLLYNRKRKAESWPRTDSGLVTVRVHTSPDPARAVLPCSRLARRALREISQRQARPVEELRSQLVWSSQLHE
jgi:hypothetical protein